MTLSLGIPKINITTEAEDDDNHSPLDISETLTDVEDLFEERQNGSTPLSKRNKLKIILSDNGATTDLEDFEASSDDEETKIIEHKKPLQLTDLDLEAPVTDESYRKQTNSAKGKRRMKTEFATKQKSFYHSVSEDDKSSDEGIITDTEAYETENDTCENIPDIELNLDAYKSENLVADNITSLPSTPVSITSDYSDNGSSSVNLATKPTFLTQNTITNNEGGLTDAEVLRSNTDSDNEVSKIKIRRRRHRCHRRQSLTDLEDVYLSDDENMSNSLRRPKRKAKQLLSKHKSCVLSSENEDDETVSFPLCKPIAKKRQTSLRIPDLDTNFQTDVEDIEGDIELENEELFVDEAALEQKLKDISSNYGQVKEEFLSIRNKESLKKSIINNADPSLEQENTEKGELNLGDIDNEDPIYLRDDNTAYKIKFSPTEQNFESSTPMKFNPPLTKNTLSLPLNTEGPLTDYENIDSSPDETSSKEIPVAMVQEQGLTDEEVFSGDDINTCNFVEETVLPTATRNLVLIKEDDSSMPTVRILPLESLEDSHRDRVNTTETTDEESISEAEELFDELYSQQSARVPTPALTILDDGHVNVHENVMRNSNSPIFTDPLTDTEEVILENKQKRKRAPKFKFMYEKSLAKKNTLSPTSDRKTVLTDTEDILLSDYSKDDETVSNKNSPVAHENRNIVLTDTENIEYSGDDQDFTANRLFSVTPQHMRELGGDTVLLREGSGPFSIIDKLELNKFHLNTPNNFATPVTTDSEDLMASAEEDLEQSYSRAVTATPNHVHQELDDMCGSNIHSDSSKKFDLDAPDEVMYLKGGGYSDPQTDTEYLQDDGLMLLQPQNDNPTAGPQQEKEHIAFDFENYSVTFECKEWDATGKPADVAGQATLDKDAVQQGEEQAQSSSLHQEASSSKADTEEVHGKLDKDKPKKIADQHQLSDEMKELLKEMEKESKQ